MGRENSKNEFVNVDLINGLRKQGKRLKITVALVIVLTICVTAPLIKMVYEKGNELRKEMNSLPEDVFEVDGRYTIEKHVPVNGIMYVVVIGVNKSGDTIKIKSSKSTLIPLKDGEQFFICKDNNLVGYIFCFKKR